MEMMTKTGTYHMENRVENQDAVRCADSRRMAGVFLADGMSSCAQAGIGAQIACRTMELLMMQKGADLMDVFSLQEIAQVTVKHVYYELCRRARETENPVEEYASTLACALLDRKRNRLLTLNLGDGLIAGVRQGELKILSMPDDTADGCCGTTTRDAASRTAVAIVDTAGLDQVFVCSDGAWRQLFEGNRLRPEAAGRLQEGGCGSLAADLRQSETFDDCSFAYLDLNT